MKLPFAFHISFPEQKPSLINGIQFSTIGRQRPYLGRTAILRDRDCRFSAYRFFLTLGAS